MCFLFYFFKSQASRPEQSVMQALESLTETQVSITYAVVDYVCAYLGVYFASLYVIWVTELDLKHRMQKILL